MKKNNRPIAVEIFAGAGLLGLGLEAAGFEIAAAVEIDPIHALVHKYNFPNCQTICKDIRKVNKKEITTSLISKSNYALLKDIDILAGGSPCQSFSREGKQEKENPRNLLIFEFSRLVGEIKPKYFLFENVPGFLDKKFDELRGLFTKEIRKHKYKILPWRTLNAAKFGVPQNRKRVFLLGYREDMRRIPPLEQNIEHTVEDAIADLCQIPPYIKEDLGLTTDQITSNYSQWLNQQYALCHKRQNQIIWGHLGSNHSQEIRDRFLAIEPGKQDDISRFKKLNPLSLSPTIKSGTNRSLGAFTAQRPIHYRFPRCITIREACRLHSCPDWIQVHRTIHNGFGEIGNSVPPLLAKAIGSSIIKALNIDTDFLSPSLLPKTNDILLTYSMTEAANYWKINKNTIPPRQRKKYPRA